METFNKPDHNCAGILNIPVYIPYGDDMGVSMNLIIDPQIDLPEFQHDFCFDIEGDAPMCES